jgi:uncharacterized protein YhfF
MSGAVKAFWAEFLETDPALLSDTPYQVWYFGNSSEMARELGSLVLSGTKTATASLLETNRLQPENAPVDDGYSVVTDFEGQPLCVIRTAEIRHLPFKNVDAAFAFDEGEGDRTLESWRKAHRDYFIREAAQLGFPFDEDSIVCCERFRLLFAK